MGGIAGAGLAALLSWTLQLRSPAWYALAVFPVAVLLAVASGALPAWRAARIGPLEAIISPVRRVRRVARCGRSAGSRCAVLPAILAGPRSERRRWPLASPR